MKRYGAALIGAGDRGTRYSKALSEMDAFDLISVCDIQVDRRERAKTDFDFHAAYEDYQQAVMEDGVDVVVICPPAYLHPEIGIFAMENGKHVVSEKPIALSLRQAADLIEVSKKYDKQLALGLQYHNMATYRKIKNAMLKNMVGTPRLIRFSDIREIRPKRAMHDAETGNGGPMVDMVCHFVDLMRWFFQAEPVKVNASIFTFAKDRPEIAHFSHKAPDTGDLTIEFDSGDVGSVQISWGLPPTVTTEKGNEFTLIGPEGLMEIVDGKVICKREEEKTEIVLNREDQSETETAEVTLLEKFVGAIEGKGSVQRGGLDGYIALATSLAAVKSSALGRPVMVEEILKEKPDLLTCMQS